ncbi:unnamed protein product [Phytomonas sp. Hart1]|nr:unnamed protein product [Phytomonas sp. Hart1]|eukprot:CCW68016.1 unnamed protein product [Phytomonas sp. isolate Hart1]
MLLYLHSKAFRVSNTLLCSTGWNGALRAYTTSNSFSLSDGPVCDGASLKDDLAKNLSNENKTQPPTTLKGEVAFDGRNAVCGATVNLDDSFRDNRARSLEGVEDKRRRLMYQSRYRGMVEMDLVFGHFARCKIMTLPDELLDEYDVLLRQLDNDLFQWLVMKITPPDYINALKCFHEVGKFIETEKKELWGNF